MITQQLAQAAGGGGY
ncbi:hypothetical protein YPPY53_1650, partial [Yersinia pestis PY-53]